jgi:hypothetical protein
MSQTTTTLVGSTPEVQMDSLYLIDFTKIKSVNDLVLILAAMGISFSPYHPHFDTVKGFLNLDNPIAVGAGQTKPKVEDIKMPKLKNIKEDGE